MMARKALSSFKGVIGLVQTLVGLVLLVVLAIALNALFASRSSQTASQPQQPVSQSPSLSPTAEPSQADATAGWQQYLNEKDGYAIKYPNGWFLNEKSSIITSYDPNQAPGRSGIPPSELKVWIVTDDNPQRLDAKGWVEERTSMEKNQPQEMETTVTEQREIKVGQALGILQKGYRTTDPRQTVVSVYFTRADKAYAIFAYPADSKHFDLFLRMLGSFRFL
jgi:hypothetical protein